MNVGRERNQLSFIKTGERCEVFFLFFFEASNLDLKLI